ncbi:MAG TPA: S41 family peptidase [Bacteroidales bacterium]|nr:S41 family peptidase [Bacteroidales bacterium]
MVNNIKRLAVFLFILLSLLNINPGQLHAQLFNEESYKFSQVLNWIDNYYVDSVNQNKLVQDAIVSMMKDLDPHSSYMTPEEVKELTEPLQGNFEGIGISFNIYNDTIYVISPISGGPSEKVGLQAGDRIIKVDGKDVAGIGITNKMVFDLLRGDKGTQVKVSVLRRGEKGLLDFTITRDKIPIYSLDAAYKIKDNIGYIRLNRFAQTTGKEFSDAMGKLKSEGVNDLILDLTGNGGGYLDEAVYLADQFLGKEKLIVYTQGLHSPRRDYFATSKGDFQDGKLIILIDEGTASASEIVSGAVQDWDRGVIMGRRSFGKGLVQRPFPLQDGSMIRLTIAKYYTPTGRLIQKPYNHGLEAYEEDLINRYNHGEFLHKDSIHFPDSLKYRTLKEKRIVYGGGGIMPDIFVPLDTTSTTPYYRDLIRKGILNRFVIHYLDENRESIKAQYSDFDSFLKNFEITPDILDQLSNFAESEELEPNKEELEQSANDIRMLTKAYIARDLWDTSSFYQIYNQTDKLVNKAVNVMENWNKYQQKILSDMVPDN